MIKNLNEAKNWLGDCEYMRGYFRKEVVDSVQYLLRRIDELEPVPSHSTHKHPFPDLLSIEIHGMKVCWYEEDFKSFKRMKETKKPMKKYQKKLPVVEAEQWFKAGDVPEAGIMLYPFKIVSGDLCHKCGWSYKEHGFCQISDAFQPICPGTWIVKKADGNIEVLDPTTFEREYKPIKAVKG